MSVLCLSVGAGLTHAGASGAGQEKALYAPGCCWMLLNAQGESSAVRLILLHLYLDLKVVKQCLYVSLQTVRAHGRSDSFH